MVNDAGFRVVNLASAVVEVVDRDCNIFDTSEDRKNLPKITFPDISYHIPFGNHANGGRAFVFAFFQRSVNPYAFAIPVKRRKNALAAVKRNARDGKRFSKVFKSITFDNGSEFADCAGIEKSIYGKNRKRTKAYYCHPYSAYERGTNENINKMIRRFLPKGTDFRKVTAAYILRVETWINNYPREILGFASSNDLFSAHLAAA